MSNEINFPIKIPAIQVKQPLGIFYVVSMQADLLLGVAYSTPAKVLEAKEKGYTLFGGQRGQRPERFKQIARYIDTVESAFPNSIIIGANYHEDGTLEEDEKKRWYIEKTVYEDVYTLVIPTPEKLASVIDGQHRLFAFNIAERKTMPLLCSVYLDLPIPYHAYIFATINMNQKKVDKSLAYELFGFSLEQEPSETWAPETFAVYLARILNTDKSSPFYGHIMIGIEDKEQSVFVSNWTISMATIVDGIIKLISANPKLDRDAMHKISIFGGRHRSKLNWDSRLPLRELFINVNDAAIFKILINYFSAINNLFWSKASDRSYIRKTVGVQALFDILKLILLDYDFKQKDGLTIDYFEDKLATAAKIDYSNAFFQASGKGRGRIKNIVGVCNKIINIDSLRISSEEKNEYQVVLNKYMT